MYKVKNNIKNQEKEISFVELVKSDTSLFIFEEDKRLIKELARNNRYIKHIADSIKK